MLYRAHESQLLGAFPTIHAHTATITAVSSLQYRSNAEIISRLSRMVKKSETPAGTDAALPGRGQGAAVAHAGLSCCARGWRRWPSQV